MSFYNRKRVRLQNFDYSSQNYYFITICTNEKKCIFGQPDRLNALGKIAEQNIQLISAIYDYAEVDCYVVMPNHIHMILVLKEQQEEQNKTSVSDIIGKYKSSTTKQIRQIDPELKVWQRSFYDHVIRNQTSYEKIWNYVTYNDQKWYDDQYYEEIREG